jgi:NAD(P)-dependent dehydrogenase (short-subunit alcohol dehydrogenase family)
VIFGASSGIGGRSMPGSTKTYIVGWRVAQNQAVAAQLSAEGLCIGLAADLADAQGPHELAVEFARHEPRLNILVNNAGANEAGTIDTASIADWDKVMNINLRAGFFLIQQLLPQLRAAATAHDPARIININLMDEHDVPTACVVQRAHL